MVISFKDEEFYYIFKTDGDKMYGNKILRFRSFMNSFYELDPSVHEFTEEQIENEKHFSKALGKSVYSFRILGKVVQMKDSEIRLIVP